MIQWLQHKPGSPGDPGRVGRRRAERERSPGTHLSRLDHEVIPVAHAAQGLAVPHGRGEGFVWRQSIYLFWGPAGGGGGGRTRHQGRFQCEAFPWPAVCVGSSKSHHQLIAPDSTLEMRKARLEEFSLFAWSHR